jgi:hypothetical protein
MSSKYIPSPIPQRRNQDKAFRQTVRELVSVTIMPIFGTKAYLLPVKFGLPRTLERGYGEIVTEREIMVKGKPKKVKDKRMGYTETKEELFDRAQAVIEKLDKENHSFSPDMVWVKENWKERSIQHYKV